MSAERVRIAVPDRAEVKAFLTAIKDRPDDVALRLILADWLEDRDDPRGPFVRAQCYSAWRAAAPGGDADRWDTLAAELRRQNEPVWLGRLREHADNWQFVRGLLRLTMSAGRVPPPADPPGEGLAFFRNLGRSMRQMFQLMTGVTDSFAHDALRELAESETWAWVETLTLRGVETDQVSNLLESPLVQTVSGLDLASSNIGYKGVVALGHSPRATRLRWLSLSFCNLGPDSFHALARSPNLSGLQELHLGYNLAGDSGAMALALSPHLRNLRVLSLEHNQIETDGAIALADSPNVVSLRSLSLNSNGIGREGALALAQSPNLANLAFLLFHDNPASNSGRAALRDRFGDGLGAEGEDEYEDFSTVDQ